MVLTFPFGRSADRINLPHRKVITSFFVVVKLEQFFFVVLCNILDDNTLDWLLVS